ncbi:hypothetical protein LSH36_1116g00007 [Paralvinella palmiformis]|uniref:Reverse transcriptase domain-containing protein n=1 Tax=Paralvinella palmiformis TaxID=53620 RepID=A0AAD9IVG6_9ANNE|nr:hypothetical protein LSH36_1116g00007 [Paralvinella palmiformis]
MHGHAGDTQVYVYNLLDQRIVCLNANIILRLEDYVSDIHTCMSVNKLKLNTNKTEIMLFGISRRLNSGNVQLLSVAGTQVNKNVKTSSFHLRNIGHVRKRLTESSSKQLVQSLQLRA